MGSTSGFINTESKNYGQSKAQGSIYSTGFNFLRHRQRYEKK